MNRDNYASLEASKRLVEAGIVLETDMMWKATKGNDYKIYHILCDYEGEIPAPCMSEVIREFKTKITVTKIHDKYFISIGRAYLDIRSDNLADGLIEALILSRRNFA